MRNLLQQRVSPKSVILFVVLFLASFALAIVLWLQLKDAYGQGITFFASKFVAGLKGVHYEGLTSAGDIVEATFSPRGWRSPFDIDITVRTSSYTFNVPLTLSIMTCLFPFITRKLRAYGEGLFLLLIGHFLYVFTFEAKMLTEVLVDQRVEQVGAPALALYQFLWGFVDNLMVRFEPFLIGVYLFFRFKRR